MRMQVGKTATSSIEVHLEYHCSKCGHQNHAIEKIAGSGSTGTFAGVELNRGYVAESKNQLAEKLQNLCNVNPVNRYTNAEFSCKCSNCKHREPWAKMRYGLLRIINFLSGFCAFFCLMACIGAGTSINLPLILLGLLFVLTSVLKPIHIKLIKKQIAVLPAHAIPRITMKNNNHVVELCPPSVMPDDCWVCCSCGEWNSNRQSYCRYCNTTKSWSESQTKH